VSVQTPGSSLSLRLPTLPGDGPVWLTHGVRGPGVAESEEAQEGSAQLEVALPFPTREPAGIEHREGACRCKQNVS
jgi:hypothetical protein